jgi:hypothetical protein
MNGELVTDSLVYRYDPEVSPDGLRGVEGTFAYVDALARARPARRRPDCPPLVVLPVNPRGSGRGYQTA